MKLNLLLAILVFGVLADNAAAEEFTHEGVTIFCPWAEATEEGEENGSVYMEIYADDSGDRQLTAAYADIAEETRLSTFERVAGVLQRKPIESVDIGAGQTVRLEPGGHHILLNRLKNQLVDGEEFNAWLAFNGDDGLEVEVQVVPRGNGFPCEPEEDTEAEESSTLQVVPRGSY